ncbi:14400_t:CDS:2, partial [Funneliformis geosporum]
EGLLFTINDNNLLGITTKHRLKQLQQKEWLASSLLLCWPYTTPSKDSDWIANALLIPEQYKEFATDLRKYSLLFLEQLSYSHGRAMLTFADLSVYQNTLHIGKIPAWFIKLQESLSNPITGELH